jgi:hypothetical protein
VDIELASLGSFLKSLHIGVHGKAMVVSARGRVIAYPSEDWSAKTADGAPLPLLSDLGDPLLTRIYDRLKVEGFDREIIEISGHRIFASSAALKALTGRNWSVLIVAEQSELLGFVGSSAWLELGLVVVVFLLIAGLAALMIWRSRLAERHDLEALQRQHALEARAQTLSELAGATDLMDRSSPEGVRELTERTGEICGARRVGAWYLTAGGRTLVCDDNFDRLDQAHTAGAELHRDEFPSLFAALESRAAIIAPHAARDPRTAELATLYLRPLGVEGVHITPLHYGDRLVGMLKVEDPVRGEARAGMTAFCAAVASMLALRYGAAGIARQMVQTEREPTAIAAGAWDNMDRTVADHQSSLGQRLLHYGLSEADIRAASIASAAVAAIQLPGWLTVARGTEGSQGARMDMLMDEIQRIVARVPLAYATLLDDQVVLVAHSGGRAIAADGRDLAKGALELRNRLLELTGSWEGGAEFRIGVDVGPVMMSSLADGSRSLWGGAITIAKVLAGSGGRRAITASEAAYQILSGDFLFRQRGSYFLPETGTMRTFVLVGNL